MVQPRNWRFHNNDARQVMLTAATPSGMRTCAAMAVFLLQSTTAAVLRPLAATSPSAVTITFGDIITSPPSRDGFVGYTMDYWNSSAGDNWLDTSSVLAFPLNDTVRRTSALIKCSPRKIQSVSLIPTALAVRWRVIVTNVVTFDQLVFTRTAQ